MDSSTRVGIQEGEYAPPDATGQFPLEDLAGDRKRVAFTAKHAECLVSFIDVIPGGAHPPETDTIDPDIDARAGDCEKGSTSRVIRASTPTMAPSPIRTN